MDQEQLFCKNNRTSNYSLFERWRIFKVIYTKTLETSLIYVSYDVLNSANL